jgi:hypothetical protein
LNTAGRSRVCAIEPAAEHFNQVGRLFRVHGAKTEPVQIKSWSAVLGERGPVSVDLKFWEADVRRVEGIAPWALTLFEKVETALLRALEVAHTQWVRSIPAAGGALWLRFFLLPNSGGCG